MNKSINLNSPELRKMEKDGRFHARAFLQGQTLPIIMMQTADYIQKLNEPLGERFRLAVDFMTYDLEDAFSNPVDRESQWGLNLPISGYFYEQQTQRILDIMPKVYGEYFRMFAKTDSAVVSLQEYFNELPDITVEEMWQQANEFDKEMAKCARK